MQVEKRKKLENFVKNTNYLKYTIGLPLLIYNSMKYFILPLMVSYIALYVNITLHAENIKQTIDVINQFKKGLVLLWQPNELEVK